MRARASGDWVEVGVATLLSSGLARRANAVRGRSSRDTGARTANERTVRLSRARDARGVSGHHQLHSAAARSLSRIHGAVRQASADILALSRAYVVYLLPCVGYHAGFTLEGVRADVCGLPSTIGRCLASHPSGAAFTGCSPSPARPVKVRSHWLE